MLGSRTRTRTRRSPTVSGDWRRRGSRRRGVPTTRAPTCAWRRWRRAGALSWPWRRMSERVVPTAWTTTWSIRSGEPISCEQTRRAPSPAPSERHGRRCAPSGIRAQNRCPWRRGVRRSCCWQRRARAWAIPLAKRARLQPPCGTSRTRPNSGCALPTPTRAPAASPAPRPHGTGAAGSSLMPRRRRSSVRSC